MSEGKCYTYQNILTIDGTNLCATDTGDKEGKPAPPGEVHTYQYEDCECVAPCLCYKKVGPLWGGGKWLPEVEGWGVLQDLIPDVGWLVLPQVHVDR